ncbi:MAG: hypothetical protein KJ852_04165 [Gammaproteobacteria bacterium]|nr:hypothetical protein [Gammaproteobacteria bacterium]MBU0786589.1 hypothetical protein [Gammaproteobacteria bacterium]MBU0814340.1 hypothetical protein [Gammaproteobacteria bacterium]MBU1786140.1 hypothetical protein [Gammaproteobacteria bacterium]
MEKLDTRSSFRLCAVDLNPHMGLEPVAAAKAASWVLEEKSLRDVLMSLVRDYRSAYSVDDRNDDELAVVFLEEMGFGGTAKPASVFGFAKFMVSFTARSLGMAMRLQAALRSRCRSVAA